MALSWATLLGCTLSCGLRAQEAVPRESPGAPEVRSPTVSLITVGPGDSPVAAFGHSLILFEGVGGDTVAFSFGQSDYGRVGLLARALQGTVEAGAGEIDWAPARDAYLALGRPIWIQRLSLSAEQTGALRSMLVAESGFFAYATFDENCTTTLRDALDLAVDGRIRAATQGTVADGSLRDRIDPLMRSHLGLEWIAAIFLTDRVDGPATAWESMFLPETLRSGIRTVTIPTEDGSEVPLVSSEERLGPIPVEPSPAWVPPWLAGLLVGAGLGSALVALGRRAPRGEGAERGFTVLAAGWAVAAGLLGTVAVLVGLSPDPAFSLLNENLWHVNPGFLGVAVAGWGSHPDRTSARRLATALAILSGLGLALELLPWFDQANSTVVALALPANLGLAIGLSSPTGPSRHRHIAP